MKEFCLQLRYIVHGKTKRSQIWNKLRHNTVYVDWNKTTLNLTIVPPATIYGVYNVFFIDIALIIPLYSMHANEAINYCFSSLAIILHYSIQITYLFYNTISTYHNINNNWFQLINYFIQIKEIVMVNGSINCNSN